MAIVHLLSTCSLISGVHLVPVYINEYEDGNKEMNRVCLFLVLLPFSKQYGDSLPCVDVQDLVTRGGKFILMYKRSGKRVIINAGGHMMVAPSRIEAWIQQHTIGAYLRRFILLIFPHCLDAMLVQTVFSSFGSLCCFVTLHCLSFCSVAAICQSAQRAITTQTVAKCLSSLSWQRQQLPMVSVFCSAYLGAPFVGELLPSHPCRHSGTVQSQRLCRWQAGRC